MRDSSDYLVNTFFAAVRKKLNRDGLRWYGIRTVEPHHDGTVHWHMMVFAHPEEIDTIVSHTRDIAIQEDRHELGDDITPRFKAEYVDGSKGTPTSYIATYIGKNLDSRAVDGIDPKTGKPRVDHETGKSILRAWNAPSAGRAFTGSASSSSLASLPVRCGVNCAALPVRWHVTHRDRNVWKMTQWMRFLLPLMPDVLPPT